MENYLKELKELEDVVTALRTPKTGCPWDLEQDLNSLTRFMAEESAEYISAVASGDVNEMKDELGDVLLQVFLNSKVAEQEDKFDLAAVVKNIKDKMIRRHPHVFSDQELKTSEAVKENWEKIKQSEKTKTPLEKLYSIPASLTGLSEAQEIGRKAKKVNFEWANAMDIIAKLEEEVGETKTELQDMLKNDGKLEPGTDAFRKMEHELGDMLFVIAQLSRKLNIDAELAVKKCNQRFYSRFRHVADKVEASGKDFFDFELDDLEQFWSEAKKIEKAKYSSEES